MTNKEIILDSLANGSEALAEINQYFEYEKIEICSDGLKKLINEMLDDGLIRVDENWVNEHGEKSYAMTEKGRNYCGKMNK